MPYIVEAGGWTTHTITTTVSAGSVNVGSTEITNDGEWEWLFVDLNFSAFDPGTQRALELHMLKEMQDGSSYATPFLSGPTMVDYVMLRSGNNAQLINWGIGAREPIPYGPGTFKLGLGNGCSNTLGSGTLKSIGARWIAELP